MSDIRVVSVACLGLDTLNRHCGRIDNRVPPCNRLGSAPTEVSHGRCSIAHSEPDVEARRGIVKAEISRVRQSHRERTSTDERTEYQ